MTTRRAVSYGGLFCLLAAWLASAASTNQNQPADGASRVAPWHDANATDALVSEVQAHAPRASPAASQSAPMPQAPTRNPFLFESRAAAADEATGPPRPSRCAGAGRRRRPSRGCI